MNRNPRMARAAAQWTLAQAAAQQHNYITAIRYGQQALESTAGDPGLDHPDTFPIRRTLARWLGEAGQVGEAITAYRDLLTEQMRLLGPDHPDTLTSRGNLAGLLGESGQAYEAIAAHRDLLTDQLRVLGPDHPDTLTTRNNIAYLLGEIGQADEATTAYRDLLTEQMRLLGPDHPDTLTSRGNLAGLLGESGQADEAIVAHRDLLTDQLRVLGPDHPHLLAIRGSLADSLGKSGQTFEAITVSRDLLTDQMRLLGPDHPDTLTTRNNLAYLLGEIGQADEAIIAYRDLLADLQRVLGPDHPTSLAARANLARWLRASGKTEESIAVYQDLWADQRRVMGAHHPDTLSTRSNLAYRLGESGLVAEAIAEYQDLLPEMERVWGPGHPVTLRSCGNLAYWLAESGQTNEAISAYRDLLTDQRRVLGPDHPDTFTTRRNLAQLLGQAGQVSEAITAYRDLLTDQLRGLGPDHPDMLSDELDPLDLVDLAYLAGLWADGIPQSVRRIAEGHDDRAALYREIIDLAGADPNKSDGHDLPLAAAAVGSGEADTASLDDLDLEWLLFTESQQLAFRGGTPRSATQADKATSVVTYRTHDPLSDADITVKPGGKPGSWVVGFRPLTNLGEVQLHLRWSDGTITTTLCAIEEDERVSLLLTAPSQDAIPAGLLVQAGVASGSGDDSSDLGGVSVSEVAWTASHGPSSAAIARAILASPEARRFLTDRWDDECPTPEVLAAAVPSADASPEEVERARATAELLAQLHTGRCEACRSGLETLRADVAEVEDVDLIVARWTFTAREAAELVGQVRGDITPSRDKTEGVEEYALTLEDSALYRKLVRRPMEAPRYPSVQVRQENVSASAPGTLSATLHVPGGLADDISAITILVHTTDGEVAIRVDLSGRDEDVSFAGSVTIPAGTLVTDPFTVDLEVSPGGVGR